MPAAGEDLKLDIGEGESLEFVWVAQLRMFVGTHEISNSQFRRFDKAHDSGTYYQHKLDDPQQPAVNVSWERAAEYCAWLNRRFAGQMPQGMEARLPTEKEWTFFAAAGQDSIFPWGNGWGPPQDWNYRGEEGVFPLLRIFPRKDVIRGHNDGYIATAPVKKSGLNRLGLFGAGGNVWEWCLDRAEADDSLRVIKGASWNNYQREHLRLNHRAFAPAAGGNAMIGFRVVIAPRQKP